jgi:hypothetical protein
MSASRRRASFSGTTTTVTASPKSGCGTPNTALSSKRGQRIDLQLLGIDVVAARDHQVLAAPE